MLLCCMLLLHVGWNSLQKSAFLSVIEVFIFFKTMATDQEKEKAKSISWADVPTDILAVIQSKCYSSTRVRFGAVCHSWRSCIDRNMPISHLPWPTANFCNSNSLEYKSPGQDHHFVGYKLYDPHELKTYKSNFYIPYFPYSSRVLASKKGWLLVEEFSSVSRTLILYNPFSRRSIPLPSLEYEVDAAAFATTHASPPDSTFFISFRCRRAKTVIGSYKFSNEDWIWSLQVIAEGGEIRSMVHSEGSLYFVFGDGTFGRFDLVEKCGTILIKGEYKSHCIKSIHLVEFNGDVLLATALVDEGSTRGYKRFEVRWIISRLNKSLMTWDSERLEGRTLFVSVASFCVPAIDAAADLDGCISYFYRNKFWRIYSLSDEWYKLPDSFGWKEKDVGEKNIWIEPPYIEN